MSFNSPSFGESSRESSPGILPGGATSPTIGAGMTSIDDLSLKLSNVAIDALQSEEQRSVLNVVDKLRQCGLDDILSLPQIVVCGSQSSGKSSVLEALTEIDFPRNDNLCTRFATEIIMRRSEIDSISAKVIPDSDRPLKERASVEAFTASITDFSQLSNLIDQATSLMGISTNPAIPGRAFSKDILSIQIEGPKRAQFTVVDLPGIIQSETKGVTATDIALVSELTEKYIKQPRTICLAVIAATHDYANQPILDKVRKLGDGGERTLGVITKPDLLPRGSPSEAAFVALARNEDVHFAHGWHVLKNRKFEERDHTLEQRRATEAKFLRNSAFKVLPEENRGIEALRDRLSPLLFDHVKKELPKLKNELEAILDNTRWNMKKLGDRRASPQECKDYLLNLSQELYDVCKSAVNGNYEGSYFSVGGDQSFSSKSSETTRRLRATIEHMNFEFGKEMQERGHKYTFDRNLEDLPNDETSEADNDEADNDQLSDRPIKMSKARTIKWVEEALLRTRGRELPGNFNPLVIGELFWESSEPWKRIALKHAEEVSQICSQFLKSLLTHYCPKDVYSRLWNGQFETAIKRRQDQSIEELNKLLEDLAAHPKTLDHEYAMNIRNMRFERNVNTLRGAWNTSAHQEKFGQTTSTVVDFEGVARKYFQQDPEMIRQSCEDVLDGVESIYKLQRKTFIDNVITQVVERHIVRNLQTIFTPVAVSQLSDDERIKLVSERSTTQKQRARLQGKIDMLMEGKKILSEVMMEAS